MSLSIPARFNGPARSGNGGFVAGALAERLSDRSLDRRGHPADATAPGHGPAGGACVMAAPCWATPWSLEARVVEELGWSPWTR